jgi:sulfite exporter TauE/SafE/copper chaperone CopZ/plastocyanin domain-containing protein
MKTETEGTPGFRTLVLHIGGMTCINCQNRIEKKLKSIPGMEDAAVNFTTGTASVTYNTQRLTLNEIAAVIEKLGYKALDGKARIPAGRIIGILVIILSLYMLLRGLGLGALTSAFPLAEEGMSYGMLFIIGLITSVHCVAMCGGINLSQCIPSAGTPQEGERLQVLLPSALYNAGRVLSYTLVGAIVGALGSVITLSGRFQGAVQLAAGVFMMIMGINMLGIFPALRRFNPRMPGIFARKIEALTAPASGTTSSRRPGTEDPQRQKSSSPLIIGLLNGLMPCGPLQAMQLYALSTGSPITGGISMFLFSLGTVPFMFGIGALSSALSTVFGSHAFTQRVMKAGAILVTVLGMTMFTNGWNLSGLNFNFLDPVTAFLNPLPAPSAETGTYASFASAAETPPLFEDGVQVVNSTLSPGRYPAITVQQGIPVKWIINAPQGSINGCNNRMIIREYGIEHRFTPGENMIEFTPEKTGKFSYSCWMGMIRSSITVAPKDQTIAEANDSEETNDEPLPVPAGVVIPTDRIVLAEIAGTHQTIKTNLRDEGIEPAIIVVQKRLPASLIINNDSLDPGNSKLIFPAYYTQIDMKQGDNTITFMPLADFDYSTGDNIFYGYVKVVENINDVDIETIKAEVSEHETLIYPEAYFDRASAGAGRRRTPSD